MSSEADSLRRSKRNKFHLDVASMHLAHPERRRTQPGRMTPSPEVPSRRASSLSPATHDSPESSEPSDEKAKRVRRIPARNSSYVYDDSDDDHDLRCETSPLEMCLNSSPPQLSPPAAFNSCITRSHTEPGRLSSLASNSMTPPLCRRIAPAPPTTPPPHLVRAMNTGVMLNRAFHEHPRKCIQCPYKAKTGERMKNHMIGHQKTSGFQCPFCTFKSESAGFLKRHVEMHGSRSYAWPPVYVGINPRKQVVERPVVEKRPQFRSTMKVLFLRCALQHAPVGSPMRWPCPMTNCKFSAAVVSQHVVHHLRRHVPREQRRLPRYTCMRCGVFLRNKGALRIHRILRHTRRRHPKALQYFMRERVGYDYIRCFTKPKFTFEEAEEKPKPSEDDRKKLTEVQQVPAPVRTPSPLSQMLVSTVTPSVIKIEPADNMVAQAVSIISDSSSPEKVKGNEFSCALCPYGTSTRSNLMRHEAKHQVKDLFNITVPAMPTAATHLPITLTPVLQPNLIATPAVSASTTPGDQKPKCVLPPRRSSTEPSLRFIGSDGVKRRRCLLCPYVSKFSCDMRSHMEMHSMNARFKCSQCSYSTKRAVSLRSHIALHTEDNAIKAKNGKAINIVVQKVLIGVKRGRKSSGFYSCAHCPFVTRICADLWRHARRHMGASKRFNCSLCSFSSISLDVMEEHQLLHPEGVAFIRQHSAVEEDSHASSTPATPSCTELKCDVCPFKTTIYQRMWNHRQKHRKTSKYVCSKCTFSTGSEMCLEEHMIVHSEPGSTVDTGTVPSRSQSAEGTRKSGSDELHTPDSQKASTLDDSGASMDGALNSSVETDVKPSVGDVKVPLSINVETALSVMRPTKEVLPVLKRDRQDEVRRQCPDCPFMDSDEMIYNLHREMHGGRTRAFACNLCNYSCFAPETLHWHLSLHLPSLSPASVVAQRKRGLGRRFQASDPIPLGAKHFSCTQCSFRTVNETNYLQHRQQHAQHIQQRLVTQMKRAASQQEEDNKRYTKMKRAAKKSDKHHACIRCAFRCDTSVAYSRHLEMHTQNALFKCR
ncbi:unnamed protein product [Heligmosomoides polygyrus]|uniref:C2H2-type domain-containing protein n=1 Tax=Heligmosomoides polygyrus TaxID=6339 RepID=A0A183FWV0_HELPZ|nr:unnamed protein product [Heligmosomoides polygyrus]